MDTSGHTLMSSLFLHTLLNWERNKLHIFFILVQTSQLRPGHAAEKQNLSFFWQLVTISFHAVDWRSLSVAEHQMVAAFLQGCSKLRGQLSLAYHYATVNMGDRSWFSEFKVKREMQREKQRPGSARRASCSCHCALQKETTLSFSCWFVACCNFILYCFHCHTKNFGLFSVYFSIFFPRSI